MSYQKHRKFPSLMVALAVFGGILSPLAHANPGWGWNGGCGGGYYRGGWNGGGYYHGACNPGGWYCTGIPNGLGWTMFGLAAAAGLAAGASYAAPAPVYVPEAPAYVSPEPVIVPQQVVVQPAPVPVQAPLVICNGIPCYYINGNYYPANPVR